MKTYIYDAIVTLLKSDETISAEDRAGFIAFIGPRQLVIPMEEGQEKPIVLTKQGEILYSIATAALESFGTNEFTRDQLISDFNYSVKQGTKLSSKTQCDKLTDLVRCGVLTKVSRIKYRFTLTDKEQIKKEIAKHEL